MFLENISPVTAEIPEEDQLHEETDATASGCTIDAEANDTESNDQNNSIDSIDTIHELLGKAYNTYQDDDGYVNVATAGHFIKRTKPDFDCRTYGYTKLPQFLQAFPERYEVIRHQGKGTVTIVAYKCLEQSEDGV